MRWLDGITDSMDVSLSEFRAASVRSLTVWLPSACRCSRVYWSTTDARKRCVYTCKIVECRPPVVEPDINSTVEHDENMGRPRCSWALEVIQTAPATMTHLETWAPVPWFPHHLIGDLNTSPAYLMELF